MLSEQEKARRGRIKEQRLPDVTRRGKRREKREPGVFRARDASAWQESGAVEAFLCRSATVLLDHTSEHGFEFAQCVLFQLAHALCRNAIAVGQLMQGRLALVRIEPASLEYIAATFIKGGQCGMQPVPGRLIPVCMFEHQCRIGGLVFQIVRRSRGCR